MTVREMLASFCNSYLWYVHRWSKLKRPPMLSTKTPTQPGALFKRQAE